MKNKIYNIIYLSGLLIDSQAYYIDNENEGKNISIPKIPEEVINQKINIDIDLLNNSKLVFGCCYVIVCVVNFVIIFIISNITQSNFLINIFIDNFSFMVKNRAYIEKIFIPLIKLLKLTTKTNQNEIDIIYFMFFSILIFILQLIIIPITIFLGIIYIKTNSLFKSWLIYTSISLFILLSVQEYWIWEGYDFWESLKIYEHNCQNCNENEKHPVDSTSVQGVKVILTNFIVNNIMLFSSYYMLKGYYHLRPIKYKEKRDYINSLNNPIPVNVLDSNLIVENNII